MKIPRIVYVYSAATIALWLLRMFIGVDITDESQYAAQAYTLLLGVAPFEADLLIQQTASLLILPLVKLYVSWFGTEAFVLFLRFLYLLLALGTGLVSFLFLRKFYHPALAWLASTFMWIFIPGSVPSWSYNTVSILGLPLSLFLLFGWGARAAFAGGIMAAVVCFVYPTMAVVYAFVVAVSWWQIYCGRWQTKANHLAFLVAAVLGGSVSLYYMFAHVGADKISELFTFSKSFGELGGIEKFEHFADRFLDGFRRTLYVVIFPVLIFLRWKKGAEWFNRNLPKILIIGLITAAFARIAPQKSMGWMIYACLFVFCVLFSRLHEYRKAHDVRWLFLTSGILTAFMYAYSSGNGFLVAAFGLILPLQILTLEAGTVLSRNDKTYRPAIVFLCLVGFYLSFHNFYYIYRGQSVSDLTHIVSEGPHKFLVTNKSRKDLIDKSRAQIVELSKTYKTLFAAYFTPAYLYTSMKPVTGMLYAHEEHWQDMQLKMIMYRSLKHDEWPDVVFTKVSEHPGFVYQFEDMFLASGKYEPFINEPEFRVLKRKDLN